MGISLSTINKKPPLQGVFFCCLITLLLFLRTNSSLPLLKINHTLLYPCYLLIISTITPSKRSYIKQERAMYIIIYSKPLTWLLEPLMASNPKRIIEELTGRLHSMRDSYITTQFLTVIQFLIHFKRIVNRFLSIFTMSYNNYFATH